MTSLGDGGVNSGTLISAPTPLLDLSLRSKRKTTNQTFQHSNTLRSEMDFVAEMVSSADFSAVVMSKSDTSQLSLS